MLIASASRSVVFHDYPSGTPEFAYQPESCKDGPIKSISWSKDGNWLALVPNDGFAEIVSIKEQLKLIHTVQDVEEPTCASFENNTKKHLGIGTKSGLVLIYDIKARHVKKRFPRGTSVVTHVAFTAKDSHVVAACKNGDVLLFSNTSNNLSGTFRVPRSSSVTTIRTNNQKRHLILGGSSEGVVVAWDTNASKCKYSIDGHNAPVTCVAFSPINSDLILSTGLDRQFLLHDIDSHKCIARIPVDNNLNSVDFSPDGMYFILGCQNGKILVHDTRNIQEPINIIESHTNESVKHLYFQNLRSNSMTVPQSPVINIEKDVTQSTDSMETVIAAHNDSFGVFMVQSPNEEKSHDIINGNDAPDSFMDAIGLGHSKSESGTFFLPNSAKKTDSIKNMTGTPIQNPNQIIHDRLGRGDSRKISFSTPLSSTDIPQPTHPYSPVNKSHTKLGITPNTSKTNIRNIAKEVFQEELTNTLQEVKQEVAFQLMNSSTQLKRMYLDLQMSMIKEFIKLEKQYNHIKEGMNQANAPQFDTDLQEENMSLKQRIAELEAQVALLKMENGKGEN